MSKSSYYDAAAAYLPDDDSLDEDQPLVSSSGGAKSPLSGSSGGNQSASRSVRPVHERVVTPQEQAALATYWFGWSFLWLPLLVVVIPSQIIRLSSDEDKGAAMGTALLLGSFVSLFAAPVFGSLSDHSTHPLGRRRPYMITADDHVRAAAART